MRHKTEKIQLAEHGVIREEALLAYIRNELAAEEKQELEKLLQDDPFAQEALEGLREADKERTAVVIAGINKKVRERTGLKEAKTIQLHWSTYAWAAVVFGLLIGVGFLMVNYMGNRHNETIAMNEKPKEETVNLTEQNVNQPNLVSAGESSAADSTPSISANGATVTQPAAEVKSKPDNQPVNESKPVPVETKTKVNTATGSSASSVNVTSNNSAAATVTTPPVAKSLTTEKSPVQSAAKSEPRKDFEEGLAKDNRSANAETKKSEQKSDNKKEKAKQKNAGADNAPATETIMRGALMEKVEANKVTVITMDDAMKNFNSGDYKSSAEQFTEILKQQPNNADALYFGGISEYINGNEKKSEKNFDKLLKDGTKFVEGSKWYKANILIKKGKRDEAKKLLDDLANSGGSYKERAVKKRADMEF